MYKTATQQRTGDSIKQETIDKLKDSETARLIDLKAAASAYNPVEISGKLPANWVPRMHDILARSVGRAAAAAGTLGAGVIGFFRNRRYYRDQLNQQLDSAVQKSASYSIERITISDSLEKNASVDEVRSIMKRVYNDDPSYWPYGLDVDGHESLYLIRDNMTKAAAGFVGWQEQRINGRKIGSYSIGILPEFRSKGFAKEAVAKIIMEKSAQVDEVRSYVCSHNARSKGLANSLGINIQEKF